VNRQIRPGLALVAIALAAAAVALVNVHATGINGLQWTQIGPAPLQIDAGMWQRYQGSGPDSGEVVDIAIDPRGTTDQTIYIASGSGGIWKSTDNGTSWRPLTDYLLSLSTGAVALDPGNPSIIYAGTGNPAFAGGGDCPRCNFPAVGIYKSLDGGNTWTLLPNSPAGVAISRIVLPKPGVLLVATTGGLYRSLDAGAHFSQLTVSGSPGKGINDIRLDTQSPSTTVRVSISGLGIFVSNSDVTAATPPTFTDLWTASNGSPLQNTTVPGGTVGDIAFAQSTTVGASPSGNTIYATVQNATPTTLAPKKYLGMWVSTDDGGTWTNLPGANAPGGGCQCGYDLTIGVDPTNDQTVYIGFQKVWKSTNGGGSFGSAITLNQVHDDNHAFVFSPHDATGQTFYTGQDGGIAMTTNGGTNFTNINGSTSFANGGIASNLLRHIDIGRGSNSNRQWTYGGFQDTGNAQFGPGYTGNTWQLTSDGDGGPIAVDPCNPMHAISTDDSGYVQTTSGGSSWSGSGTFTLSPKPPAGFTVAANAFAFDQTCDNTVYAGFKVSDPTGTVADTFGLYQSTDNGNNYTEVDSLTTDVTAIATVKIDPNVVWIGLHDGSVAYSTNALLGAAATWTALPDPSGTGQAARGIAIDPITTDTVFVVYPGISGASPSKHIFKTTNRGAAPWVDISGTGPDGLPDLPLLAIAIDPATNTAPRTIIVGGDGGMFQTTDDGASWQVLGVGLPTVGVTAVALDSSVSPSLLRIGTYGRSSFELVTPSGPLPTTTTYTGVTTKVVGGSAALSATLVLQGTSVPVAGQTITFTLGSQSCMGTTDASGMASCSITLTQLPGPYTVTASFAGSGMYIEASSDTKPFTITKPTVLANISTRLPVGTGDNVLIAGFIVTGNQNKKVIVRAIGPSLTLAGKLADPILELHDGSGALLEMNDNWQDSPNKQAIIDSTIPPSNPLESAIVRSVPPGNYTAIERGVNNGTGIGVVEAYDLDTSATSKLANISTRGLVQTGDNVLIAGTIVVGQASQKVIIRALGPSTGVPGAMADPTLELHDGNGALLEANDNWVDSPNKQAIIDSTIPPPNNLESAIVRILTPGNYTAIVRGVNNSTGIAVVEVYALN
jgi:hypothetical protein